MWVVGHVVLAAATLFAADSLLLKFDHASARWLPLAPLVILGTVFLLRRLARKAASVLSDLSRTDEATREKNKSSA